MNVQYEDGLYPGVVQSVNGTSVSVLFPDEGPDGAITTLPKEQLYLITDRTVNHTSQSTSTITGLNGSTASAIAWTSTSRPHMSTTDGVSHLRLLPVQEDDHGYIQETTPLPLPTTLSPAPIVNTLTYTFLTAPLLALEALLARNFNASEPGILHATDAYVNLALGVEVGSHSRKVSAAITAYGPPRHFAGTYLNGLMDHGEVAMVNMLHSTSVMSQLAGTADPLIVRSEDVCLVNVAQSTYSLSVISKMPNGPLKSACEAAIDAELAGLNEICWVSDDNPPPGALILDTKVFCTEKMTIDDLLKVKARCVVLGFRQPEGSYGVTEAPILMEPAMNCLFAIIAANDLDVCHVDWKQAFISAPIDRPTWIRLPLRLGGLIKRLLRQLYGMKQAPKEFHSLINRTFTEFGLVQSKTDPCVYHMISAEPALLLHSDGSIVTDPQHPKAATCIEVEHNGSVAFQRVGADDIPLNHTIIIGQFVDDMLFASTPDNPMVPKFLAFITAKQQKFTVEPLQFFLNMMVTRDRAQRTITLSQQKHVTALLQKVFRTNDVSQIKCNKTPLPESHMPSATESSAEDRLIMTDERVADYRSWVASLLWISRTRPEIKWHVSQLCRYMQTPSVDNLNDLKKVCRYLAGPNRGLVFQGNSVQVSASSDSDWATCKATRRSCTGYIVKVGNSVVAMKSKMQSIVALSSMEAELVACTECCKSVVYQRTLLTELGFKQTGPSTVQVDNQSCIQMNRSQMATYRNRHIPLRYHFVKDLLADGTVDLEWVRSEDNVSDLLTKSLGKALFEKHRDQVSASVA